MTDEKKELINKELGQLVWLVDKEKSAIGVTTVQLSELDRYLSENKAYLTQQEAYDALRADQRRSLVYAMSGIM